MAGLRLGISGGVTAAAPPSQAGTTIGQLAYGVNSGVDAGDPGPAVAGYGALAAAGGGAALLIWLWYSLPR